MSDLASQVLTADDVFVSHVRSLQVDAERALAAMRRGDFRHVRELLGEKLREHTMPALACLNEIEGLRAESGERRATVLMCCLNVSWRRLGMTR